MAGQFAFPDPHDLTSRDVWRAVGRLWPFVRPYRRQLGALVLLALPALPTGLAALMLIRVAFDVVGQGRPLSAVEAFLLWLPVHAAREAVLWRLCVMTYIATLIAAPYGAVLLIYATWLLQRVTNRFRVDLYGRMQARSLRFHGTATIGDAMFRMFQDSAALPQLLRQLVFEPLRLLPFALFNLGVLAFYSPLIALVALAVLPADLALAWYYGGRLRRAFLRERAAMAQATARLEATLASIKAVKACGRECDEAERYARDNWQAFMAARGARLMLARYQVATHLVRGLAYIIVLAVAVRPVLSATAVGVLGSALTVGAFAGLLRVFHRVNRSLQHIMDQWGSAQDVVVGIARVLEMLHTPPEEALARGTQRPPPVTAGVTFDGVTFGYEPRTPVLTGASFEAPAGAITALVGASGAGKSTILALLLRFYEPQQGAIRLDGVPVQAYDLGAWRAMLSVVLQDHPLFSLSLRDNVVYGRADASDSDILRALARAGLGDFVRALPHGLATVLGEHGATISTGQAQRLALARAFVRGAPILLLDEPTAALDAATEAVVMRGIRDWLQECPGQRLAIIATHQRTTAAQADRIYRLVAGTIEPVEALPDGYHPQ
jgi:ABC-type multidrug transport system fused ATPase/permease subunit